MPTFTPAQAKKILKKRGITDPVVIKKAVKAVAKRGPSARAFFEQTPVAPIPQFVQTTGPSSITRTVATADLATVKQLQADLVRTGKKLPIKAAVITGPKAAIGMAAVKLAKVALKLPGTRQAAEKVAGRATTLKPFLGRGPTLGQAAAFAGGALAGESIIQGGLALAERAGQLFEQKSAIMPRQIAVTQGGPIMQHGTGRSMATLPGVGGMLPPGTTIVKTWHTGTAQFARLADGRIAVQRKDGTIKVYRPAKHIVIPRNPRVATLIRADKRLDRLVKGLRKAVRSGKR